MLLSYVVTIKFDTLVPSVQKPINTPFEEPDVKQLELPLH